MAEQLANLASTTLSAGINNTVTSIPVVSSAAPFPQTGDYRIAVDNEIMLVTAVPDATHFTATRGAEGTTAASHSSGATVAHVLTAGGLDARYERLANKDQSPGYVGRDASGIATAVEFVGQFLQASGVSPWGDTPAYYLGRKSTAGPPATGSALVGYQHIDSNGVRWSCITAGTPGTWVGTPVAGSLPNTNGDIMTYSPLGYNRLGIGTAGQVLGADTSGLANWANPNGDPDPGVNGLKFWNMDIAQCATTTAALTNGVLYLCKVPIPYSTTVTSIWVYVNTAGATLTANQCLAALYDSSGNRLQVTGNQATAWQSTGAKQMTITSQAVTAGSFVWVGLLHQGTTPPQFLRAPVTTAASILNLGTTAATSRWASSGTGQTATPTSFTPSAVTPLANGINPWVGLS